MPPDAAPGALDAPGAPPSDAVLNAGDLRAAVGAGLVSEAQAVRLAALGQSRRGLRAQVGDEPFELFRGLNDVFVAVGVAALGLGLWLLGLAFGDAGPGLLGMAGAWALAEYLTRIRRMTLPSLLLAIGFVASAAFAATGFAPSGIGVPTGGEALGAQGETALMVALKEEHDEQMKVAETESAQTIKDLKMAHDRNIAKLTKDMRENSEKLQEQLKASLEPFERARGVEGMFAECRQIDPPPATATS